MIRMQSFSRSLSGRLALGLGLVALVGTVVLFGLVALEYVVGADEPLTGAQLAHEVADHVAAPVIVLLGLVALAGSLVIKMALRPLASAAADVDRAAQTAPRGVRIDFSGFPLEAQPFAAAINRLLERLDAAAQAQEAFASDAAHELKTPLTILSLELERLDGEGIAALREDVAALNRLVDQLLLLARLDAQSAAAPPLELVDPGSIATELAAAFAPLALKASRNIALEARECASFLAHREAVAAALRNLVDNALRVTPPGGTVTLIAGPGARLAVRDEGAGLSPERLAELSHRGRRADHASATGAGLGLSIVAKIMAAHAGAIRTDPVRRELILEFQPREGPST